MKKFIYIEPMSLAPILIITRIKPSIKSIPECGTWVVREFTGDSWSIPCFPEITWAKLNILKFIGEIK